MPRGGLAHEVSGEGEAIILLHPVGLDSGFWRDTARLLANRFRVICPDLPGHGQTPLGPPTPATTADYAAMVADFIAEETGPVHTVIGLSFGGMIAQELALARPDLLRRLVLAGCTATFPEAARPGIRERGALAEREGMDAIVETTLARWFSDEFLAQGGAEAVSARLLADDAAGWAAAWRAISTHDAEARLKNLSVSALCLAGEKDVAAPPAAVRAMAAAIPSSSFAVIPSAPHMMHLETPAAFSAAVLAFIG